MTIPAPDVVLPHTGDKILIEEILAWGTDWIEARGHKDRLQAFRLADGSISTVAAIELICQTAASHAGLTELDRGRPVKIGFIIGARSLEFDDAAFQRTDEFHVAVRQHYVVDDETCVYKGEVFGDNTNGPLIGSGTITAVMPGDSRSVLQALQR